MGTFSIWHWLIVLVVVLLLFGGGSKIPRLMRDMGTGINAFKKGLKEDGEKEKAEKAENSEGPAIEETTTTASSATTEKEKTAANG